MLELSKRELVRQTFHIRNPSDERLTVCIEPWADRYELETERSLDLVFLGPNTEGPEILSYPGELVIYGWDESEVFVVKDGRIMEAQTKISDIVLQEFEIAEEHVHFAKETWPVEEIEMVQHKFDHWQDHTIQVQHDACELTSYLVCSLADCLSRSDSSAMTLWKIADRVLNKKGVALISPNWKTAKRMLWRNGPLEAFRLMWKNAVSFLPGCPIDLAHSTKSKAVVKQPASDSQSGKIPH